MCETRDAHIIVLVDAQSLGERLGRILLALIGEPFRAFPQVGVEDSLQTHLPLRGQFCAVSLGDRLHVGLQCGKKLREVGQRVANHRTRPCHRFFGTDAMAVDYLKHVVGRAALREAAAAVHPHVILGTVHIVLVGHKHLAQVIHLARSTQQFGLDKTNCRIVPARAAAVLVLHRSDRVF